MKNVDGWKTPSAFLQRKVTCGKLPSTRSLGLPWMHFGSSILTSFPHTPLEVGLGGYPLVSPCLIGKSLKSKIFDCYVSLPGCRLATLAWLVKGSHQKSHGAKILEKSR